MATITALLPVFALDSFGTIAGYWTTGGGNSEDVTTTGDPDIGVCLRGLGDGKTISVVNPMDGSGISQAANFYVINESGGLVTPSTTINSVKLVVAMTSTRVNWSGTTVNGPGVLMLQGFPFVNIPLTGANTDDFTGSGTYQSAVMPLNPFTGLAWDYDDIFAQQDIFTSAQGWFELAPTAGLAGGGPALDNPDTQALTIDYIALVIDYVQTGNWWKLPDAEGPFITPGTKITVNGVSHTITGPIFDDGDVQYDFPNDFITIFGFEYKFGNIPNFIIIPWTFGNFSFNWYFFGNQPTSDWVLSTDPTDGWWFSAENFAGDATIIADGVPRNPRTFAEVSAFATGTAGMLGGAPGPSCTLNNRLFYAKGGYTVGTDVPTIHQFDGQFDRQTTRIPKVAGSTVPKAVMTMITANGSIYLSTFDTGSSAADWSGRVFELNVESGTLTPMGSAFSSGDMPYALCFHQDRLWMGTNKGNGTSGKVYFIRPGIDTDWTLDHSLSTDSVGGVTSMFSFQGNLMVGTDAGAGTFAKVLSRDPLGVWTTSLTATGGAATVNNGFLSMHTFDNSVYDNTLYSGYWNGDSPRIAKVYKFDGSSWTTAYNGSGDTLVPYIGIFTYPQGPLFVVGGGNSLQGVVLRTPDGVTWTDESVFLEGSATAIPVFGSVVS